MILCPTLDLHISVFMLFCCLLLPRSAACVSAGGGAGTEVVYSTLYCVQGGQLERLRGLLQQSPWSVDARCRHTGDTALIKASRQSHDKVRAAPSPLSPSPPHWCHAAWSQAVALLVQSCAADVTLQNDVGESALDVATPQLRHDILGRLSAHPSVCTLPSPPPPPPALLENEDRAMSTAQALLESAWLGDAVSVMKHLVSLHSSHLTPHTLTPSHPLTQSGRHYINVNCRSGEGLTPLLLVTRDIGLFEQGPRPPPTYLPPSLPPPPYTLVVKL